MGVLTAAQFVAATDALAQRFLDALGGPDASSALGGGANAAGIGAGDPNGTYPGTSADWGVSGDMTAYGQMVVGWGDLDLITAMLPGANTGRAQTAGWEKLAQFCLLTDVRTLWGVCGSAALTGVTTIDTYATYYNVGTGGPWTALLAPPWRFLHRAVLGSYPTATNVYFEVRQGTAYPNGLRKLVVGTGQTAGHDILSTEYAGGTGAIRWSGATGSDTVTVTGDWRKTDGTVHVGAAGTATLSGASGVAPLTPPDTNALLLTVTGIVAAAGVTAGTIYAEARRPVGRLIPVAPAITVTNPGAETGDFTGWTEHNTGIGTFTVTSPPHSGVYSFKIVDTGDSGYGNSISQVLTVSPLTFPSLTFWALGTGWYEVYDVTHSAVLVAQTPVYSYSSWTRVSAPITVPAGCTSIAIYLGEWATGGTVWFDDVAVSAG